MVELGSGDYTYEVAEGWGQLPDGWTFKEVAAVGVDANDNVYCFNRGEHPMIIFDKDGNFLRSWGEGVLSPGPRHNHGAGRHHLLHRRRRPYRPQVQAGRDGAVHSGRQRDTGPFHERRPLQPLHSRSH